MTDIRKFNGIPYKRVTESMSKPKALKKAREMRYKSYAGWILARVDTYKGGYAVWMHDKSKQKKKKRKPSRRLVIPYSCPECGAEIGRTKDYELHSGGVIECLQCGAMFSGKRQPARKMKPLKVRHKKRSFSSKKKMFEAHDRSNKRTKVYSHRMNLIKSTAKWTAPNGEKYEAEILFQYYNDYFEEGLEGKEAIAHGGYQVMFSLKTRGEWGGTNTLHVDPSHSSAKGDYRNAITVLKTVHRMSMSQESSDIDEFLYRHFYELWGQGEWDKFE